MISRMLRQLICSLWHVNQFLVMSEQRRGIVKFVIFPLPLGHSVTAWPTSICHVFFSISHYHMSTHQNPLLSIHPSICICSLSPPFYLLLFEQTERWELLQPIMILRIPKVPALICSPWDAKCASWKSRLIRSSVMWQSAVVLVEVKEVCLLQFENDLKLKRILCLLCSVLSHQRWNLSAVSETNVAIIMFSAHHFCYPSVKSIEGRVFVWNVSMQRGKKKSENVFSFFVFFFLQRRHTSLPPEVTDNQGAFITPLCRRSYPCRKWKSATFG